MQAKKECTECKMVLDAKKFYKKRNGRDSKCSSCVKAKRKKERKYKALSKAGNEKRICKLKSVRSTTIDYGDTREQVRLSLLEVFRNDEFNIGVTK